MREGWEGPADRPGLGWRGEAPAAQTELLDSLTRTEPKAEGAGTPQLTATISLCSGLGLH
jgi:hypothetical protein